eukprot:2403954-Rhodomonas_salina.1
MMRMMRMRMRMRMMTAMTQHTQTPLKLSLPANKATDSLGPRTVCERLRGGTRRGGLRGPGLRAGGVGAAGEAGSRRAGRSIARRTAIAWVSTARCVGAYAESVGTLRRSVARVSTRRPLTEHMLIPRAVSVPARRWYLQCQYRWYLQCQYRWYLQC